MQNALLPHSQRPLHPVLWIAAVSAILFCVAGIAAFTGLIPAAGGKAAEATAADATGAPLRQAAAPAISVNQSVALPAQRNAEAPTTPRASARKAAAAEPRAASLPAPVAETAPTQAPVPAANAPLSPPAPCHDCGVIEAVREVTHDGEGSGLGAVAGGVVGGVVGNQIGNGRGRDLATLAGIVGGAMAGHQIEKTQRKTAQYEIVVRFDDNSTRKFTQDQPSAWQPGECVKVQNGVLASNR